jgi:hypothetical protein
MSPQKGTSLDVGPFLVERWRGRCDRYTCWKGVHILLCGRHLTARGSFRLSICRGSGGGDRRRNDGRKDSGNYWEEQRVAMKNGNEGGIYFTSRSGIMYYRENACGWYWGGRAGLHAVCLDLTLLARSVPKFLIEKNQS